MDPLTHFNGTFTVAVSDIVAAGSSGYEYATNTGDTITSVVSSFSSGDILTIDYEFLGNPAKF